jgi:hypothetical protein
MPYILIIKEQNDSWAGRAPVRIVHSTKEEAEAALAEYVTRNWDTEVGDERPSDAAQMIGECFSDVMEAAKLWKRERGAIRTG